MRTNDRDSVHQLLNWFDIWEVFAHYLNQGYSTSLSQGEGACEPQDIFGNNTSSTLHCGSFLKCDLILSHSRRKHDVTCLVILDVVGLGLPNDNNFQPITSFVSIVMLGNEIVHSQCNLPLIWWETRDLLSLRI